MEIKKVISDKKEFLELLLALDFRNADRSLRIEGLGTVAFG